MAPHHKIFVLLSVGLGQFSVRTERSDVISVELAPFVVAEVDDIADQNCEVSLDRENQVCALLIKFYRNRERTFGRTISGSAERDPESNDVDLTCSRLGETKIEIEELGLGI